MPIISVIIPTLGDADPALLAGLRAQTLPPDEIEVVRGVSPNGRARNAGIARTTGEVLVLVDDDARPGHPELIANLVAPLLADPALGVTGAARLIPPESSAFQRRTAREVARIENPLVHAPLETRPGPDNGYYCAITTTCCALRRSVWEAVGRFDETLVQGVDTEFFVRVARAGYRLVQVPDTWVYHPAPATLRALLRKHFRYGFGHAQEVARDPRRARGLERHAWAYLLFRTLILIPNVFLPFSYAAPSWRPGFKPLKALVSYASALGYVWGHWRPDWFKG
jgi:GT2 family glycosyltransferase